MEDEMSHLERIVTATKLSKTQVTGRQLDVFRSMLRLSRTIQHPNFHSIETNDLRLMFRLYDEVFFDQGLGQTLSAMGSPLTFRLSRRMTSAGGKTTRWHYPQAQHRPSRFEIALSTTLLFESFQREGSIRVTGLECQNRLEAMQRVMEHELVHLAEMLIWFQSSCSAQRFLRIANQLFQHQKACHELLTPQEKARSDMGIKIGDRVAFEMDGRQLIGTVNRITRRATVLVPSQRGQRYTDGGQYMKYYVPLSMLRPALVG